MVKKAGECKVFYLNNAHARVEEDGSFGILGGVLILVEVEVVGAVPQLGQMEVSPLEGLENEKGKLFSASGFAKIFIRSFVLSILSIFI